MKPRLPTTLALLASVASCLVLAACGGSDSKGLLTPAQSRSMENALNGVQSAVSAGDCAETAAASQRLRSIVNGLPSSVDSALRGNLLDGADTVSRLSIEDCAKANTTSSSTTSSSTSSSTTSSSTTSSSTSSSTTSSSTTSSSTTPPPDGGGGVTPGGGGVTP